MQMTYENRPRDYDCGYQCDYEQRGGRLTTGGWHK